MRCKLRCQFIHCFPLNTYTIVTQQFYHLLTILHVRAVHTSNDDYTANNEADTAKVAFEESFSPAQLSKAIQAWRGAPANLLRTKTIFIAQYDDENVNFNSPIDPSAAHKLKSLTGLTKLDISVDLLAWRC